MFHATTSDYPVMNLPMGREEMATISFAVMSSPEGEESKQAEIIEKLKSPYFVGIKPEWRMILRTEQ